MMSLSRAYLSSHEKPLSLDIDAFAEALEEACPEVVFALLLGSSRNGHIAVDSDIDLAVYVRNRSALALYSRICDVVSRHAPGVYCDLGFLKSAEPIYRFEALKGRLLFVRDMEVYLDFYPVTCREYEQQMFDYERQHRYRVEAA